MTSPATSVSQSEMTSDVTVDVGLILFSLHAAYVSLFSWDTTSIQKSAKLLVRCARSMLGTVGI